MMFSLCRQLRLDFTETTRPLTTHALYSSTLTELNKLRNEEQKKTGQKVRQHVLKVMCVLVL